MATDVRPESWPEGFRKLRLPTWREAQWHAEAAETTRPIVVERGRSRAEPSNPTVTERVTVGLAERAIRQALIRADESDVSSLVMEAPQSKVGRRRSVETNVILLAEEDVERLLPEAGPGDVVQASRDVITQQIEKLVSSRRVAEAQEGKRFYEAKERAVQGQLSELRTVGGTRLVFRDLEEGDRRRIKEQGIGRWESAATPWGQDSRTPLWWSCGAVFGLQD